MSMHIRRFAHGPIRYEFRWNSKNHLDHMNASLSKSLWSYLTNILNGEYPEFYFLPISGYRRASKRRVRGIRGASKIKLIQDLKDEHYIIEKTKHPLNLYSRQLLSSRHPDILTHLLRNDPNSIAIEVPVWSTKLRITGHIDLIRFEEDRLQIIDFKPAGDFFVTLPQIATYAAILLEHIPNLSQHVECVTFNKDKAWFYQPTVLQALNTKNHQ